MKQILSEISFETNGEGFLNITTSINQWLKEIKIDQGIIIITTQHTSCSLIINENADPNVLKDLSTYFRALVPEKGFRSLDKNNEYFNYQH